MKRNILILLFIFYSICSISQIKIQGKIIDTLKRPIEDVTLYITKEKDSTIINYATTNINGDFIIQIKPIRDSTNLIISLIGYKEKMFSYSKITENLNLGNVTLNKHDDILPEIVIITDIPIRMKKDTLEFNASSFKVRPDANLEMLLKQLPGIEIDAHKKITVNGKSVAQILVNNKPFFTRDGKIALQNLPAELINKIQVTEYSNKTEQFTGRKSQSNEVSINLTIDEEKNKGLIGRIMAGYGTDKRYESSGLINYFKGTRQISLLASSNNINSTSFSMDDIFDNMAGGRSQSFALGSNSITGNEEGNIKSNLIGLNYSDSFFDKIEVNTNYNANEINRLNKNKSRSINLLPETEFITESSYNSSENTQSHSSNTELEYNISTSTKILITNTVDINDTYSKSNSQSLSMDENQELFNENSEIAISNIKNINYTNSIEINKKVGIKGSYMSLELISLTNKMTGSGTVQSNTILYKDQSINDKRNQQEINRSTNDKYLITLKYSQAIVKNTYIDVGYTLNYSENADIINTYNYNENNNTYNILNDRLSNYTTSKEYISNPFTIIHLDFDKFVFKLNSGVKISDFKADADYMNILYSYNKKFINPYIGLTIRYSFLRTKYFHLNYNYQISNPSANQVLKYERLNDPLNTYIGNPDLNQRKQHTVWLGISEYNLQSRSGWNIGLNGTYDDDSIILTSNFDESKKRISTYQNIRGNYNINFNFDYNLNKKWAKHNLTFGFRS